MKLEAYWENNYYAYFTLPPNLEGLVSVIWDKHKATGWLVHASGARFLMEKEQVKIELQA